MWQISGKRMDAKLFHPMEPQEVLYDFDGPRTFTHLDADGQLCLAHWSDENPQTIRYLVVPFTVSLVQKLKAGELTLRDALDQPRFWIVDSNHAGEVTGVWLTKLADVPADALPRSGTMLWPSLEPLIGLRALGEEIQDGQVPGSVILGLVDGVRKALKLLAEYVLDQPTHAGRPSPLIKRLFDLPAQRVAFGSFEISFRSPISAPDLFKDLPPEEWEQEKEALKEVGNLLREGLDFLVTGNLTEAADTGPDSDQKRRVILQALKNLTPSSQGAIQEVEIWGELVGTRSKPVILNRTNRKAVNQTLALRPSPRESLLEMTGRVRELDKDRFTFELRDIEGNNKPERQLFSFEPEFHEDVMEAFSDDTRVRVVAVEEPSRRFWVLAIVKAATN